MDGPFKDPVYFFASFKLSLLNMMQGSIEKSGSLYSKEGMLLARKKTWEAIGKIRSTLTTGMLEEEAAANAETILKNMGVERKWHRSWIRFGENSVLQYGVLSKPGTLLRENDICFLDLGPVFDGFEGDAGTTFVFGSDPEMHRCARDVKEIFDRVKAKWQEEGATGKELYIFAHRLSQERGWLLNLDGANGHRLSDFPHALHHKGPISELDFKPSELLWVLEIQIRHPEKKFGAFFEDLLVTDPGV